MSTLVSNSDEKNSIEHVEMSETAHKLDHSNQRQTLEGNLHYINTETEPELGFQTYMALSALFALNLVQVFALTGPVSILAYIGRDLNDTANQAWISTALSIMQAVFGPIMSFASDSFQARKVFLIGPCLVAFAGCAVAPGATSLVRVVGAQIMIGVGFAAVPLAYAIPSEILPRRWRPMAQSLNNVAANCGFVMGLTVPGALTRKSLHNGWRQFYWIQMAVWGLTALALAFGYQPPKRKTELDNQPLSHKLRSLDLPGTALLAAGLALFITGLSLGGNPRPWDSAAVLAPLIVGAAVLIAFGTYEWKCTTTGILHHQLFAGGRAFPLFMVLIFVEGIQLFSLLVFYTPTTEALFETDPLLAPVRLLPFVLASAVATLVYGFWSTKARDVRWPLLVGFVIFAAGLAAIAGSLQPTSSTSFVVLGGLCGAGFGAPLILIIAGTQLCVPHSLIATGTAVITSTRAVAAAIFTASYSTALTNRLSVKIPGYIAPAALQAGLPPQSLPPFIGALANNQPQALAGVPGVTPVAIEAGIVALRHALADSFRIVYLIAAPFGVVAVVAALFLPSFRDTMHYEVDAPVEELQAKSKVGQEACAA
ncbi:hypothetical protein OIV83_005627 [Microbotryomycetes sp. JL201]|nr:hypothetical protein OIV83_005627 [Microbotryomycetes sp. JL201]